ncbi:hypothetical protein GOODEAATRI_010162 [Goodea atripinnis]|uniref:Uncharacterized protein n=1 Tax=Goodea atripinnis TaxID=208336 RepID=A0ABV0MQX3_9TELE
MFLLGCHNRFSKQKQVVDISLATMLEAFLSEPGRTKTKCAGLISMHDYALHVQSSSGDVINLFQQETDAWISHTDTHTHTHKHTHTHTHTRLLSGKQSQRHGVTETKPQMRCLALSDNPLTLIYIQGLEYASVTLSPPPSSVSTHQPNPTFTILSPFGPLPQHPPPPQIFHPCYLPLLQYLSKTFSLVGFISLLSVGGTWPCMAAFID